jgi:arylsulfatase A-like enzyme
MANSTKPNILVIFGDDIGMWNLSCYSGGMMGYKTPPKEFPPRQKAASFTIDQVMEKMESSLTGAGR